MKQLLAVAFFISGLGNSAQASVWDGPDIQIFESRSQASSTLLGEDEFHYPIYSDPEYESDERSFVLYTSGPMRPGVAIFEYSVEACTIAYGDAGATLYVEGILSASRPFGQEHGCFSAGPGEEPILLGTYLSGFISTRALSSSMGGGGFGHAFFAVRFEDLDGNPVSATVLSGIPGDPPEVPEPASVLLVGSGFAGLALARRRRVRA